MLTLTHLLINSSDATDGIIRFFGQYNACWCPGSLSRQSTTRDGIDSIA